MSTHNIFYGEIRKKYHRIITKYSSLTIPLLNSSSVWPGFALFMHSCLSRFRVNVENVFDYIISNELKTSYFGKICKSYMSSISSCT